MKSITMHGNMNVKWILVVHVLVEKFIPVQKWVYPSKRKILAPYTTCRTWSLIFYHMMLFTSYAIASRKRHKIAPSKV